MTWTHERLASGSFFATSVGIGCHGFSRHRAQACGQSAWLGTGSTHYGRCKAHARRGLARYPVHKSEGMADKGAWHVPRPRLGGGETADRGLGEGGPRLDAGDARPAGRGGERRRRRRWTATACVQDQRFARHPRTQKQCALHAGDGDCSRDSRCSCC